MDKLELVNRTLEDLNKYYPPGLYDWMYLNNKYDYNCLIDIETRIDELFINNGTEDQLKALLIEYWQIHKKNIELFKSGQSKTEECRVNNYDLHHVRTERLEERRAV